MTGAWKCHKPFLAPGLAADILEVSMRRRPIKGGVLTVRGQEAY